ncbi:MAG TPA: YfhO family protein [Verrucomicrobiae bacterium]|nr:YfhO family protein [Verrucomicrobiae bacterium]
MSDPNRIQPKPDAAAWPTGRSFLLLLAAALIVAFPKVVLGLHTFFYRDFAACCYPLNFYSRDAFLHGQLPLWNPYSECGLPHLAQLGQWYPPVLLALFLPMPWGIQHIEARADRKTDLRLVSILATLLLLMLALVWVAGKYPFPDDQWNLTAWNTFWRAILMLVLAGGILLLPRLQNSAARMAVQLIVLAVLPLVALTHSPGIAPTLPGTVLAPGLWQASGRPPPPKLGEGRVMISPDAEQRFLYSRVPDFEPDLTDKRLAEWYNFNLLDHVPKVNGAIPLHSAYFDLIEQRLYYTSGSHFGQGLLDFLSVAWFSASDNPAQWLARTNFLSLITAGQKPAFADDEISLSAITASDFDPCKVVYLPESERSRVAVTNQTLGTPTNARFGLNRVEADVNAAAPSLVVLSQCYYHLWRAFVDGRPVPLLRANLAFQAVGVPAGTHHVKLIYRDPDLETGTIISALSLAAGGLIWLRVPK